MRGLVSRWATLGLIAMTFAGGCAASVGGYPTGVAPSKGRLSGAARVGNDGQAMVDPPADQPYVPPTQTQPPSTTTPSPGGLTPVAPTTPTTGGCAGLDYLGACEGGRARWCETNGQLTEKDCAAEGLGCGFINNVIGYYCMPAAGSTPPPSTQPTATSDEEYCVDVINQYRASLGLQPYRYSPELSASARNAAESDSYTGQPHGDFSSTGGGGAYAENEIPGWPLQGSVRDVIDGGLEMMWNEGPGGGHYESMSGNYSEAGCGISSNGGVVWSAQRFR